MRAGLRLATRYGAVGLAVSGVSGVAAPGYGTAAAAAPVMRGTACELVSYRATGECYQRMVAGVGHAVRDVSRFLSAPGCRPRVREPAIAAGRDSPAALERWVTTGPRRAVRSSPASAPA